MARLVFRGHLLPAFVTPFRNLREFMQVVHPLEMETIGSLKDEQMEAHMGKFEKEYDTIRATVHQQVSPFPFSSSYIGRTTSFPSSAVPLFTTNCMSQYAIACG